MDVGDVGSLVAAGAAVVALGLSIWATVLSRRSARASEASASAARYTADQTDRLTYRVSMKPGEFPGQMTIKIRRNQDGPPTLDLEIEAAIWGYRLFATQDPSSPMLAASTVRNVLPKGVARVSAYFDDPPLEAAECNVTVTAVDRRGPDGRTRSWVFGEKGFWRAPGADVI